MWESELSNINSTIGEEKILKSEKFENNKILPKSKLSYKKKQYFKLINKRLSDSISIKEINKQKIKPNSLFKETFSNINAKRNKRIIYNNNFTNSYSKNSISNSKVPVKSFLQRNNFITSGNNLYNKKIMNNNKIQRSHALKVRINLKNNLSIETNNNNNYSTIKDKYQKYNSYDY